MADLMISSSMMTTTTTPSSSSVSGGGGGSVIIMDAQTVTPHHQHHHHPHHHHQTSPLLISSSNSTTCTACLQGGGGSPSSSPASNGTIKIPHPQNGQQLSCIVTDNASCSSPSIHSSHNYSNAHHHHNHNNNVSSSHTTATVTTTSSPSVVPTHGGGLLQHNRNHSYPLLFTSNSGANTNNSNHVESSLLSSSSVSPEMAMANNGGGGDGSGVVTALPSSTTMDILNLDFVNGNSSYCHNGRANTTSPLSIWPTGGSSHLKAEQLTPTNVGCIDHHHHHHQQYHSPSTNMTLNSSTTEDSPTISNSNNGKVPGEIPESVMKYLLTKSDSVESTKSAHSSSGSSPSSNNSSSSPNNALSPLSEHHHHNKRLQEFLVDLDTLQSTTEIAKVLENFNAILERIEQEDDKEALEGLEALTTPLSPTVLQCPTATVSSTNRIKNSVETLADLLLSGCGEEEDEDLLIIIDENESDSFHSANGDNNCMNVSVMIEGDAQGQSYPGEDDELDDDVSSLVEIEGDLGDLDQEEGYESDRPIVRASMRKLRPVKLLPMPSSSHHNHRSVNYNNSNCNNNPGINTSNAFATPPPTPVTPRANSPVDPNVGLATTLNSPIANKIIVASLINSLNSSAAAQEHAQRTAAASAIDGGSMIGQSSVVHPATSSSSASGNCSFVPTLDVLNLAGGSGGNGNNSQSQGHIRSQSSSSQVIQFHQNPVTISTNPAGFVEVSIGNGNTSGGGQATGSSNATCDTVNLGSTVEGASSRGTVNPATPSAGASGSPPAAGASSSSQTRNGVNSNPSAGGAASSINPNDARTASTTPSNSTTSSSSTSTTSSTNTNNNNNASRARPRAPQAPTGGPPPVLRVPAGRWPHRLSSVLAVVGCTLGLNNICRFSLLSVQYGANFILQFIFLSFVFGIPLLTFHMSIGQYLSSGIIDMWKISPIFQGIGVGLVISQAMIGIYTTVGVSWIFIYFRDSFITRQDQYRWGKCVREFGDCDAQNLGYTNSTVHLYNETVPDYFNAVVLQRASPAYPESAYVPSSLKFTVAFNLAVVWMIVFVSLSKGLKSYGKVVHGFVLAPVTALFILAFKMVNLVQAGGSLFGQTRWSNFFFSSQTWVAAARETFFTWGLLGACVMQITAHNRHSHSLKSDSLIVIMVTLIVLMLSAFIGNACFSILTAPNSIMSQAQFSYVPSSFESKATYRFLEELQNSDEPVVDMYDHHHISFLMGVRVIKQGSDFHQRSGYQVLRLATELFPATMAVLSQTGMSSFWTVLFYFAFVLFGIGQQIAIWHCVIKGIIAVKGKVLRSWETTITFFVCGLGFVLGLPLCTETGIFIQYFMDYAIGSGWWIMVLYLLELIAVFIVRGAPYCGENIVTVLVTGRNRVAAILAPLISFIWNVIMPVAILVLSIASFKNGNIRELYDWNPKHGYRFWPSWTREVGSLIQLVPILAVPFVAILQSCRYLSSGPPDLFDRMQQLYRPNSQGLFGNNLSGSFNDNATNSSSSRNGSSSRGTEDPPPKYTPPPSYSTATGAKIAKFLRNSFRRSLRRLSSPGGPSTSSSSPDNLPPPPNYASVILEINSQRAHPASSCPSAVSNGASSLMNPIMIPPPTYDESTMAGPPPNSAAKYINKIGDPSEAVGPSKLYQIQLSQTLGRSLAEGVSKERASLRRIASDITSRDIARMLRQSLRRANRDSPEASTSSAAVATTTIVQAHVPPPSAIAGPSAYSSNSSPSQGIVVTIPTSGLVDGSSITPCDYTFGPNSLEKVEHDLEMLHDFRHSPDNHLPSTSGGAASNIIHSRQSSSSSTSQVPINTFGFNFGFNRARNRNSNDSQLALITSGVYEDLSVTSGSLMGALVDGEIEIDNFTQLNLPRRDSLSQLNVLDLGHNRNLNPTFRIHNATIPSSLHQPPQAVERVGGERGGDSEA